MTIGASELARLTAAKSVANTGLRWLPFFLPTLALAFDSSTARLALVLAVAEASGLTTLLAGRWLDAGHERAVIVGALAAVAVSSVVALQGSIWAFAVAAALLGAASAFVAIGGHAWIAARVSFDRRARFIGVYEVSWAMALLVGAPVIALLIEGFGWRAPFVAVGVAALVAAALVLTVPNAPARSTPPVRPARPGEQSGPITVDAWIIVGISASSAMAGLATIVVAGTWLDEVLGVSTEGVGAVAMAFGAAELTASSGSSAFADRLGKRRSMQTSTAALLVGLSVIAAAGTSLPVGAIGLLIFFLGFEWTIVTSFSLVSEAMPEARGRVLGLGSATGTVARGVGVGAAGLLYERVGIEGPVGLSATAALVAFGLLAVLARRRPDLA